MENDEKKVVAPGDGKYNNLNLDEVPEILREVVKARLEEARTGKEAFGSSKVTIHKDFKLDLQVGPGTGLVSFIKLLVKLSQPPPHRPPGPALPSPGAATPERMPELNTGPFQPGAVKPTSSGWILWLAVIILAALYFFYTRTGLR